MGKRLIYHRIIRYDRNFLLQFRGLCTEKPPGMAELEEIGLEPVEQAQPAPTTRSGRRRRSVRSNAEPTLPTPIQSAGPGSATLNVPPTPLTIRTDEEGLTLPVTPLSAVYSPPPVSMTRTGSRGGRSRTSSGANKPPIVTPTALAPPFPIVRSTSHGSSRPPNSTLSTGIPPPSPLDRRSKSLKARKRSSSTRTDQPPLPGLQRTPSGLGSLSREPSGVLDDVKPLEMSENRWVPVSAGPNLTSNFTLSGVPSVDSPELVEKKVKALLNKLTLEKFDSISDQIVAWANKSENETDGATLTLVIRLVFDKATDEATWSGMYARLCRKMMEQISTHVTDENVRDREGKPVVGGQLFRQYLLSRCQADFERGWSARETLEEQQSAAAAASGAAPGEIVFSDEYYALQKAKRRGLGLVKFIGELFKLQMLTERIMHRCILKLLDEPAEEDIESVCQLLKTVGAALSGPKGRETMDMYFGKMIELSQDPSVSQRIRFMLLVSK
jgi:translation initiation factor 4G